MTKIFTMDLTLCSKCQIYGEDFVNFSGLLRKYELLTKSSLPTLHLPIPTHLCLQDWSHLELMLQTLFCLKHQIGNNCYFLTHFSNSFYFSWGFLQLVCSWSKNVSNMHLQLIDLWKVKKWNDFKKWHFEWQNLI